MDPIVFHCTQCNRSLQAEAVHAGMLVDCPQCGHRMTIPMRVGSGPAVQPIEGRPTSVTVFGILSIVFGGIALVCIPSSLVTLMGLARHGSVNVDPTALDIVGIAIRTLLAAFLVVVGIGLLNQKRWARIGGIVYGFAAIAVGLWGLSQAVPVVVNNMQNHVNSSSAQQAGYVAGTAIGAVMGALLAMIYPILMVIFMTKPKAVASCVK
jgi:DNA-directed RNA polymerase subunit RPC12/RpoP